MTLFPRVLELLRGKGVDDMLVIGGGIIPQSDVDELRKLGVARIFGPGSRTVEIADYVKEWFKSSSRAQV
jgi:methylmalonyl-CoA mutase C-terminal domain/subunit